MEPAAANLFFLKNAGSSRLIIRTFNDDKVRVSVLHFLHLVEDKPFGRVEKKGTTEQASGPQARCQHSEKQLKAHTQPKNRQMLCKRCLSIVLMASGLCVCTKCFVVVVVVVKCCPGPQNLPSQTPSTQKSKYHEQSRNQGSSHIPA